MIKSKPTIAIVGASGSGKSTSLRNLDPATTCVLDLERKGFPFKGGDKFNAIDCDTIAKFDTAYNAAMADDAIKFIVIESFTKYNEMCLTMATLSCAGDGFKVYAMLERLTSSFLNKIKNEKKIVILTAIDEIVKIPGVDGTESAARRISTKGRAWEGKIEKEFLIVFFTQVMKNKEGNMEYLFQTNTDGVTSAKTPMAMFAGKLIPNDLAVAIKQLEDYYK
jgi:ABC-type dipeptide/oligopeptide/nickel transport system ATPase component